MDSDFEVKMDSAILSQESDLLTPTALEHIYTELPMCLRDDEYGFSIVDSVSQNSGDPSSYNRFNDTNDSGEMLVTTSKIDSGEMLVTTSKIISSANEETTNHNSIIHDPTGKSPSTEDYDGPYNFKINLSPSNKNRSSWAFSEILNKVYIDADKVMQVQFILTRPEGDVIPMGLRVRALLLYTSPDHFRTPVKRCFIHKGLDDKKDEAHPKPGECLCKHFNFVGHVLTTNHDNACYDYNSQSERHSLIIPINPIQPEYDNTTVGYKFKCKTSCGSGGMARRAARIVFTLETITGDVVGRRSLFFKVCCCPKRDKEREEEFLKATSSTVSSNKRRISTTANEQENSGKIPLNKKIKINPEEIVVPQNHEFRQQLVHVQEPQNLFHIHPDQQLHLQQQQQQQPLIYEQGSDFERLHERITSLEQQVANIGQNIDHFKADIGQKIDNLINLLMFQR